MAKKTRRSKSTGAKRVSPRKQFATELASRLQEVAGGQTYREIGEATGTHPENARRYMQMGTASVNFIQEFCRVYKVRADWLLEGTGQRSRR